MALKFLNNGTFSGYIQLQNTKNLQFIGSTGDHARIFYTQGDGTTGDVWSHGFYQNSGLQASIEFYAATEALANGNIKFKTGATANTLVLDADQNATFAGNVTAPSVASTDTSGRYFMIQNAAGNQTYPVYSFRTDGNTGMMNPGADILSLVTGGTTRLTINNSSSTFAGTVTAPNLNLTNLTQNTTSSLFLVKDEVLGAELVTNGDFDTATGWTTSGNGVAISGGTANWTNSLPSGSGFFQTITFTANAYYRCNVTVSNYSSGGIRFRYPGISAPTIVANGTYSFIIQADQSQNATLYLQGLIGGDTNMNFSVDNVSVKQVTSSSDSVQERSLSSGAFGDELWAVTPTDSDNIYNLNSGSVAIGNTSPQAPLHVTTNTELSDALILEFAGTSQGGPYQTFQYNEGGAAPSESGDLIGGIRARTAYASGTYAGYGTSIEFRNDGTISSTSNPGRVEFYTTSSSSLTPALRLSIDSSGVSTFLGDVNLTKTLNSALSVKISNLNAGTGSQSRFVAESNGGNIQLKSVSILNPTYGAGDAGVINCDTMSGGFRIAHNDVTKYTLASNGENTWTGGGTFEGSVSITNANDAILTLSGDTGNADETKGAKILLKTDGGLRTAAITGGNATYETGTQNENALNLQSETIRFHTATTQDYDLAVERMRITSAGNVGIGGVTDPDAKLEIKASGSTTGLTFKTTDGSSNENFYIMDGGRTGVRYYPLTVGIASGTTAASGARFQVANTGGDFVVMSDGDVGIGTTDPDGKLHVYNAAAHNNIYFTGGDVGGTGYDVNVYLNGGANNSEMSINMGIAGNADRDRIKTYQGNMYFRTNDSERMLIDSNGVVQLTSAINGYLNTNSIGMEIDINRNPETGTFTDAGLSHARIIMRGDTTANGGSNIKFVTSPTVDTVGTTKMTISGAGDVGIGTTPQAAGATWRTLFVGASATIVSRQAASGYDSIFANNYYVNSSNQDRVRTTGPSSRMFLDGNNIRFQISPSSSSAPSWSEIMRVDDSGNVGIGVTDPDQPLEVLGTIKSVSTAAARLILNGDSNNSGDAGDIDGIIDMLHDGDPGAFGYRINTENYGGQTALHFQENISNAYTSRLYINKDGNIEIGGTVAQRKFNVYDATDAWIRLYCGSVADWIFGANGSDHAFKWYNQSSDGGAGYKMQIETSGTLTVSADVVAYGSPSDIRLKENIKPIESALDKVIKLQGVTFDWKEKGITNLKEDIGFIAQDVQKVVPELVRENEDGMLSMRHQGIAPILLEAIKELKAEIEELKLNKCNCNK